MTNRIAILALALLAAPLAHAQGVNEVAMIKVQNASSVPLCDVRIWKPKKPGHTDAAFNFLGREQIRPGQTLPLLDAVPAAKYHVVVKTCSDATIMDAQVELKNGPNIILVH